MKKETLEEYIERETKGLIEPSLRAAAKAFLNYGAKWQQERMYREEEVHHIIQMYSIENYDIGYNISYDEWFEQFKKK